MNIVSFTRIIIIYNSIAICPLHYDEVIVKKAFFSKIWNVLKIQFMKLDIKVLSQWCVTFHIQPTRNYEKVFQDKKMKTSIFHIFPIEYSQLTFILKPMSKINILQNICSTKIKLIRFSRKLLTEKLTEYFSSIFHFIYYIVIDIWNFYY